MVDKLARSASSLPSLAEHRKHLNDSIHQLQARKRLAGPSGAMSTLLPLCDAFCVIAPNFARLQRTFFWIGSLLVVVPILPGCNFFRMLTPLICV